MADFVQTINTKTAVRELTAPIADVNTFNAIVQAVLDDNPFGCTCVHPERRAAGPGDEEPRGLFSARVVYQDNEAATVGYVTARAPSDRRIQRLHHRGPRKRGPHHRDGRGPCPGCRTGQLLRDPEVPRRLRGDLLCGLLPGPRDRLLLLG